jgi:hypothetical protein
MLQHSVQLPATVQKIFQTYLQQLFFGNRMLRRIFKIRRNMTNTLLCACKLTQAAFHAMLRKKAYGACHWQTGCHFNILTVDP